MRGQDENDEADSAAVWLERAGRLAAAGQTDAARAAFAAAMRRDAGLTARLHFGGFLADIEAWHEAALQFAGIAAAARSQGQHRIQALAYHRLAAVCRELQQPAEAARWQQRAIAEELVAADVTGGGLSADGLAGLAHDALTRGDLALAEELWRWSLVRERENGSPDGEAADWGNLGVVHWLRGDLPTAVDCLARAYHRHRALGDRRGMGTDALNMGELCATAGLWREAVLLLRRAVRLLRRAATPQLAARAAHFLADAERRWAVLRRDARRN